MRYTKKITKNYGCKMNDYMWKDNSYNHSRLGIDKLGQLEDIEEDLGIDLVKLLSAKSIFVVECDEIYESQTPFVDCVNKQILLAHYTTITEDYDFKDYGKTWAFTKEELKNETTRNDTKRTR